MAWQHRAKKTYRIMYKLYEPIALLDYVLAYL
jgi:hypothetical protein